MAAYRFFDPVPQFRKADGTLAGLGSTITFYATGTTTPKNVYSDPTLGTSIGNVLTLDAAGRWSEDPFLDGAYRVLFKDETDTPVWQRDYVQDVASGGLTIPDAADGSNGQALFTDGTAGGWYFDDVLTIPSQTGNAGKYLTSDGEALSWAAFAAADTPTELVVDPAANGYSWAGGLLEVWGSGTAPTASALHTSVGVTFAHAFDSAPHHISIEPDLSSGVSSNAPSGFPNHAAGSRTNTGFTAHFFVGEENNGGTDTITSSIPFTYWAKGPAAVDPGA